MATTSDTPRGARQIASGPDDWTGISHLGGTVRIRVYHAGNLEEFTAAPLSDAPERA